MPDLEGPLGADRKQETGAPLVVPSHCDLPGNDRTDSLAKEASALQQTNVPLDVRTLYRAAARTARARWTEGWSRDWYLQTTDGRPPVTTGEEHDPQCSCRCLLAARATGRGPTSTCTGSAEHQRDTARSAMMSTAERPCLLPVLHGDCGHTAAREGYREDHDKMSKGVRLLRDPSPIYRNRAVINKTVDCSFMM